METTIYRPYGIRGVWGTDLDETITRDLGRAFAVYQKPKRVAVARDGRLSSPAMTCAIIDGLRSQGVDVVDIGLIPVDAFYFAVDRLQFDGGAMVTASHNTSEWNGVKFVDGKAQLLTGDRNKEIGRIIARGIPDVAHDGAYSEQNVIDGFVEFIVSAAELHRCRPLRIVVDPGNGAVGTVLPVLLQRTPFEWSGINMEIDGMFPGRGPDPKAKGVLEALGREVVARHADVGVAFDADGDRMFLVDEKGHALIGEETGILLARHLLKQHPGSSFVYNVVCSHSVPDLVAAAGGVPVRTGVGSVFMKPGIERSKAIMGIETSGHYILRDYNQLDSALLPAALALAARAADERPLSVIREGLDPYAHDRADLLVDHPEERMERVRQHYHEAILDELDGTTVEYPDWWFNIRMSKSEPYLRVTIEAKRCDVMERHLHEILALIG